ncbi:MAG: hypothetical protein U1E87_01705 [Alphaproteobacteria bacterium]
MHAVEQLNVNAEISAVFAGFIAVFVAFVGRDGRFAKADGHFVQAMVLANMYTIALALLVPVLGLIIAEEQAWYWSSLAAVAIAAPIGAYQTIMQFKMPDDESQKISILWHLPGWALAWATALAYLAALLAWGPTPGFYVAGNTLSLAIAIWCFVAIVFRKFF